MAIRRVPQETAEHRSAIPLRPAQFAADHLIGGILNGAYPPGSFLPNERLLSQQLGITRPTLRETLQRLSREGWISIAHGKPTVVNDYWQTGGLSLLGSMARHTDLILNGFVIHLLELRQNILPAVAAAAAVRQPTILLGHLDGGQALPDDAAAFGEFDWQLQLLIVRHCGNPVYTLLFNDFAPLYRKMAAFYFNSAAGRDASRRYYDRLRKAIRDPDGGVIAAVEAAMQESIDLWKSNLAQQ